MRWSDEDGRCFVYDYVEGNKKQITLNEKLMKLKYSDYIEYDVIKKPKVSIIIPTRDYAEITETSPKVDSTVGL